MRSPREERWSLPELIDFELALASWDGAEPAERVEAGPRRGLMKRWLAGAGVPPWGAKWLAAIGLSGVGVSVLAGMAGLGAVWGLLDRATDPAGVNVLWLLGLVWLLPWVVFVAGVLFWLGRGRLAGNGLLAGLVASVSRRVLPAAAQEVVGSMSGRADLAAAVGWRLAAWVQFAAGCFHGGAALGLGAMVMFKRVGFFWETTTRAALRGLLEPLVGVLSFPWQGIWPWAVPDIGRSSRNVDWAEGGLGWWPFLMLVLAVWGVLPRWLLAAGAVWRERRVLDGLAFDSPAARRLHRSLTRVRRGEEPKGPVDGALVVMLDGGPEPVALRPFLLRHLRVNPTAWESLGVLDEGREEAAMAALEAAPAGIVLVAEAWALAPRRLERAMRGIAQRADGRRLALVVVGEAGPEQRREWERFVDGGKDAGGWELWFAEGS